MGKQLLWCCKCKDYAVLKRETHISNSSHLEQSNFVFKPNGISNSYHLEQLNFVLRVVGWYFSFVFKF